MGGPRAGRPGSACLQREPTLTPYLTAYGRMPWEDHHPPPAQPLVLSQVLELVQPLPPVGETGLGEGVSLGQGSSIGEEQGRRGGKPCREALYRQSCVPSPSSRGLDAVAGRGAVGSCWSDYRILLKKGKFSCLTNTPFPPTLPCSWFFNGPGPLVGLGRNSVRGMVPQISGPLKSASTEVPPNSLIKGLGLRLPIYTTWTLVPVPGQGTKAVGWLMPTVAWVFRAESGPVGGQARVARQPLSSWLAC